jgi:hypothetical protein
VTVSLFVTVTVDPTGTDMLEGLNANPEIVIAALTGGTVVVVGGGGWVVGGGGGAGGWVVGDCAWFAAPGEATLECAPAEGGAVVDETPDVPWAVGVAVLFGALAALSVVGVVELFPAGLVVVGPLPAGRERLDCDVVVDRAPVRNTAPPQAAVNVTSANPKNKTEARVRRDFCILLSFSSPRAS